MYVKRRLIPDNVCLLVSQPATAVLGDGHVEVEHKFGEDQAHLRVCEAARKKTSQYPLIMKGDRYEENLLSTDAIPWADAEGLHGIYSGKKH